MTHLTPGPVSSETPEEARIQHGLLRYVREAVASGSPLPGELDLVSKLDCSRAQLRHALAALDRKGIVRRRQGAATTVDPVGLRLSVRLEEQYEHAELLDKMGYDSEVEVLDSQVIPLDAGIAALLVADPASDSLRVRKRWLADGRPAMIASDVIVLPRGTEVDPTESIFTSMVGVWGEPVVWEVATPGVAALDAELARLFDLPEGTPVMTLELIGVGASGRRLFYSFEHHRPDIVQYSLVRSVRPPWVG